MKEMRTGKTTRKSFRRLVLGILAVLMMISSGPINAQAANVCSTIMGNGYAKKTFTVETKKTWLCSDKITFKQTSQGTAKGRKWLGGAEKTYKSYGYYTITLTYKMNNKTYTEKKDWTGKSITVKLKKGVKYTITVTPWSNSSISVKKALKGGFYGWKLYPCWEVTKTKNVIMCK